MITSADITLALGSALALCLVFVVISLFYKQ